MNSISDFVKTRHPVISALLTEEKRKAQTANIILNLEVKLAVEIKVNPVDLCILIGNVFDNAIDACSYLPTDAEKYIKARILQKNSMFLIRVENPYIPYVESDVRKGKHGYGIKNIKKVAEGKYNGDVDIQVKNRHYCITIVIP